MVREVKKQYREYGLKRFDINLIRTAASQAIEKTVQLVNALEKSKSPKPTK